MSSRALPQNVHISPHPCVHAKLSQLRSKHTNARETKALVHEISLLLGAEALATAFKTIETGTDESPLSYSYSTHDISPSRIALVPILRSGLGMIEAIQTLLPSPQPVHHLGLFRDPTTLSPVEYYNNLPYHRPSAPDMTNQTAPSLAIILDPIIATGGTSAAAIQTLREWGAAQILVLSVLGSVEGVNRAAEEWAEGVQIWVGGVDESVDGKGMIRPGVGDIGDRLFGTVGK